MWKCTKTSKGAILRIPLGRPHDYHSQIGRPQSSSPPMNVGDFCSNWTGDSAPIGPEGPGYSPVNFSRSNVLHTRRTALKLKKKDMLNYILRSSLCLTAVYLVQCLRSQTSLLSTPEFVLSSYRFFFLLLFIEFDFRKEKKSFFI